MADRTERKGAVSAVDPIWEQLRDEAERLLDCEPTLAKLAVATLLNHDRFEDALIHRLSERLAHPDVSADLLRMAMEDALELDPEIGNRSRTDLAATLERDPAAHRALEPLLYFKGFQAIQTHRFAHALFNGGRRDLAYYLQSQSSSVFQVDINPRSKVGQGIMLDHGTGVVVGETATIGDHVSILQGVTLGGTGKTDGDRHPKIGNGVLIGAGAKILGNIQIGDCSRIASGSVVLKPVPANVTVAGVPAKIVGEAGCAQPAVVMDQMVVTYDKD